MELKQRREADAGASRGIKQACKVLPPEKLDSQILLRWRHHVPRTAAFRFQRTGAPDCCSVQSRRKRTFEPDPHYRLRLVSRKPGPVWTK
jgi:hypothetical protein